MEENCFEERLQNLKREIILKIKEYAGFTIKGDLGLNHLPDPDGDGYAHDLHIHDGYNQFVDISYRPYDDDEYDPVRYSAWDYSADDLVLILNGLQKGGRNIVREADE